MSRHRRYPAQLSANNAACALLLALLLTPALAGAAPEPGPSPPPMVTGENLARSAFAYSGNASHRKGTGRTATDIGWAFSRSTTDTIPYTTGRTGGHGYSGSRTTGQCQASARY